MTTTRMRAASDQRKKALLADAARGVRPRCSDPETHDYWTSEHAGHRALAALWCHGCPVFAECGEFAAAHDERWGVWAGVDRSVRPGKKLQRDSRAA